MAPASLLRKDVRYSCKYPSCKNSYISNSSLVGKNKRFFRFPKDPSTLKIWNDICKISPSKTNPYFRLCSDHFLVTDFNKSNPKRHLNKKAVPQSSQVINLKNDHDYVRQFQPGNILNELSLSNDSQMINLPNDHDYVRQFQPINPLPNKPSNSSMSHYVVTGHNNQTNYSNSEIQSCFLAEHDSSDMTLTSSENHSSVENFETEHISYSTSASNDEEQCPESFPISSTCSQIGTNNSDPYSFIHQNGKGFLRKLELNESELTADQKKMYKIHRNVTSKLSKLKSSLQNKKKQFDSLKVMYNQGRFQMIEENLNDVTKEFIKSQFRNFNKVPASRRWTTKDKAFALSIYKRSPKLYKYLRAFFQLPSIRTLKHILSSIPFDCGLIKPVLEHLKLQVENMDELDRCCILMFDEMNLSSGLHYEPKKQRICGFVDLGPLGRTSTQANHALVFMIRGIKKQYKMPVAYFFTRDTVQTVDLKQLVVIVIQELQKVGMDVCSTVCDQGSTNRAAIASLTQTHTDSKPSPYHFFINSAPISTFFDVPHLLKNTRNALINCRIEFAKGKFASMNHIHQAFLIDKTKRTYKCLNKLKANDFDFKSNGFMKMKVSVAAKQLSHTVAAAIETFHATGDLPQEALHTAEFCHIMDSLFDSLNGYHLNNNEGKKFRCALSDKSPHLKLWSDMLPKINQWKILESGGKIRNNFKFVEGWQLTLRAVMLLWKNLKAKGLTFLNLRNLNQDPIENLFGQIRQHGVFNTNPTCLQFVAALKTVTINNLSAPINRNSNCEEDFCKTLGNFGEFIEKYSEEVQNRDEVDEDQNLSDDLSDNADEISQENFATPYVAGYILRKLKTECLECHNSLYSQTVSNEHLYVMFKENDDTNRLNYASIKLINFVDLVHEKFYKFLGKNASISGIENKFFEKHGEEFSKFKFCQEHNVYKDILDINLKLVIYKYLKDTNFQNKINSNNSNSRKRKIFEGSKIVSTHKSSISL